MRERMPVGGFYSGDEMTKRKQTLGRKKPGPKGVPGGTVRMSVQVPVTLLPFLYTLPGRSDSAKVVGAIELLKHLKSITSISEGL